jgi:lysophospholipase L1-like esterase
MEQRVSAGQEIWFQKEVKEFLKQDKGTLPPQNAILFAGSSIFRYWVTLERDMSPLPVINRAFGGARTWELLYYMDKIVLPYKPSIIAVYCGSNDLEFGCSAEDIALRFRQFCDRVHAALPDTPIFFISINKAPQKIDKWPVIDRANSLMEAYCSTAPMAAYIDINSVFFKANDQPCHELYISDGLHFMPEAYKKISGIIKPVLDRAWQEKNKKGHGMTCPYPNP